MTALRARIEEELLSNLNPVQREAVLHERGPLLILAGAGSGKTRVITHRIGYLARIREVQPYRICAVTFTNKAAEEMRLRLSGIMGPMADSVLVRTFHSLGLYILRRHAAELGLKSGFSIYDANDQEALIKKILKDKNISSTWITPRSAAERINRARDLMQSPEKFEREADRYDLEIAPVYSEYIARVRSNNALDFGDLIYETVRLFQNRPEVLANYQGLWQFFMIDEYQDTNHAQYMLGRLIAQTHQNIAVVGDDDQSIYSWRGADIRNILSFEKDYPHCLVLRLEENYRSTSPILRAASTMIARNEDRREKTLFTRREGGEQVSYNLYESDSDEAAAVISKAQTLHSQGIPYKEIAVFYRTNAQSRLFEESLRREGIPYLLVGGFRFYDRKEIKDLIAYLCVVANPDDSVSLSRIANVPNRGIGDGGFAKIEALAAAEGLTLYAAMARAEELAGVRGGKAAAALHALFEQCRAMDQSQPSEILEHILNATGYIEFLSRDESPGESRIENVEEFMNSIRDYEEAEAEPSTSDFLQQISLYSAESGDDSGEALNLITLHNAKGLEFKVVFFTGLEEGTVPHVLSLEDNIEEERRLTYVGITRAREHLFLSGSRFRRVQGSYQPRMPSRFLDEMGSESFAMVRERRNAVTPAAQGAGFRRPHNEPQQVQPEVEWQEGDRIHHKMYGTGVIVELEKTVAGTKAGIVFDGQEKVRYFLTRHTPLVRV